MVQSEVLPCPVFEGSEKRLELDFLRGPATAAGGLRCLSRGQVDMLLEKAACCIVSATPSEAFDAYVLSESSLFVYPDKMVLKTCGTTRLLDAVPCILDLAAGLDMQPCRCKFSRASYLFPELQPELYQCFAKETGLLEEHFIGLGQSCSYVLGEEQHGLQWHIYVASMAPLQLPPKQPTYTLEVCMTELCPAKAAQFSRTADFVSTEHTTAASGIGSLLSKAQIDDYVFEPCGYSMNGVEGGAFSTIHITPEEGFSYASVELCGYPSHSVDPSGVIAKVVEIFRPGQVTVSLSVDQDASGCTWTQRLLPPPGYGMEGTTFQHFSCGGCLYHYCFQQRTHADKATGPDTPSTVLDGLYSHGSSAGEESDNSCEEYSRSSSPSVCPSVEEYKGTHGQPELQALQQVVKDHKAATLTSGSAESVEGFMRDVIAAQQIEEPLYVVDLGAIARLYQAWTVALPRVMPFYAVKCFPDAAIAATLAALGAGFDCASDSEMDLVLGLGVPPERIILANCCKRPRDMRRAAAAGVDLTTFDTESELRKLARLHPCASAVLRIRADDPSARCPLGNKYGAEPDTVAPLFEAAKELGVAVVGVSFHVGSAATNPAAFEEAIEMSDRAFALGSAAGHTLDLLDIGGGFSSQCFAQGGGARDIPAAVNRALEAHFPPGRGVRIISEPGRYFAEESATLACMVIGTRTSQPAGLDKQHDYWIADGLYGSMNCLLYDHAVLSAHPLVPQPGVPCHPSTVFGPTCDGLDVVLKDHMLPLLEYGDFIVFEKLGAYSFAGMSDFNGMGLDASNIRYVFSVLP